MPWEKREIAPQPIHGIDGSPNQIDQIKESGFWQAASRIAPAVASRRSRLSFKNRILTNTLLLIIGLIGVIGLALELAVFPLIKGEESAILNLKLIHFASSIVLILVSLVFIQFISKKITQPLSELTNRADQITREAASFFDATNDPSPAASWDQDPTPSINEIDRLTLSFNRMLDQLSASEARLRESEDKYRFLFNNGPSPIFVIDAETKMILDVNTRAEEEYQYSRAEFLRMNFADLGPERHREQTLSTLQHLFPDEVTLLPIQHHKRKDGSIFMISYQASLNTFHNRPAVIAAVWDVTERIEKHTKFIQTAKMATLGEMATGIAHELNQPLSIVRLGCDYLQKKIRVNQSFTQEDLIHLLKELSVSVDRASKIINHLRQFGRVADGTMHAVDLRDPISNIFELLGRQLAASGIEWDLKFADDVPKILGDVNRLEQVFINLILNSKDAMLSWEIETKRSFPKIIRIRTFQERGFAVAVVSDTGPGISKDISSKIFEPFFTTKRIGEGTGLGLSISYGIIKEHHGIIEVDTSATQGAQFRLSFPPMKAESGNDKNTRS